MISVVIPTLNAERLLPRCFDSLIAGAVRGVVREVIVADGGSRDRTLAIAANYPVRVVQLVAEIRPSCGIGPQLDSRHTPCNLVEIMLRLGER